MEPGTVYRYSSGTVEEGFRRAKQMKDYEEEPGGFAAAPFPSMPAAPGSQLVGKHRRCSVSGFYIAVIKCHDQRQRQREREFILP